MRGWIQFNDDKKSTAFGVFVTGTGTYNAPSRDVSYIAIPGRSSDIIHDNGRFNNITVTYPCFIQNDFASNIEAFRNYIKQFPGWFKVTDTYHPDEYRLCCADSEMSVEVTPNHRAGEFDLTLTAQPFRYLKSGDDVQTLTLPAYVGDPVDEPIDNDTNFVTEADFYFHRSGTGVAGTIEIANSISTTTLTLAALGADGKEYMKFDSKTGMFLYATSNAVEPYLNKEYSIIAEDVTVTMTDYTYLPSFLAPGRNNITVTATAGGANDFIEFISYVPHWRII